MWELYGSVKKEHGSKNIERLMDKGGSRPVRMCVVGNFNRL